MQKLSDLVEMGQHEDRSRMVREGISCASPQEHLRIEGWCQGCGEAFRPQIFLDQDKHIKQRIERGA